MLLLGIDLGTSSVKVSVVDADTQKCIASASFPEEETGIIALQPGWAEQEPEDWWTNVKQAILKCHSLKRYDPSSIAAIGIAYQMHGLVLTDAEQNVLRHAIIWCDSRAVEIGNTAFQQIGQETCLSHLLNSPANFTASKLAWVKNNEPQLFEKISKAMLPGDFIAMKFTGEASTTISALSEGIFWDFKENSISEDVLHHYGFDKNILPAIKPLFSIHGKLKEDIAAELQLGKNVVVSYKAGDQPNNALALNVLQPGEVATTAGTSGVIYAVSDQLSYDELSRINSFAHVNHTPDANRIGILLCINGTGIFNRWIRNITGGSLSYPELNNLAATIPAGAEGLFALPFGNGAERMLNNKIVGSHFHNIDFNVHTLGHMVRAVQEGIVYSFRYGLDIMRENKIDPSVIRAAKTNLFLSDVFAQSFANINNVAVEFYDGDGSYGAAIGAGIGCGIYKNAAEASAKRKPFSTIEPNYKKQHDDLYVEWRNLLVTHLSNMITQKPNYSFN